MDILPAFRVLNEQDIPLPVADRLKFCEFRPYLHSFGHFQGICFIRSEGALLTFLFGQVLPPRKIVRPEYARPSQPLCQGTMNQSIAKETIKRLMVLHLAIWPNICPMAETSSNVVAAIEQMEQYLLLFPMLSTK